ncbi:hypothetical protein SDRG_06964 [Saprolegnia diclina VS20]|uniref:Uncharacterized protein n=1 Tax=Saprolegnia diclina (strain VS20) TaxID=1156394 RepID=T0RT77_SAPDV|nr:hypothetical protein SDRG_06964 [Saprolegnia diclina VS20]EQC35683.1 hypothetical protein SDRG_06964 [Saprolegnia diclina VS20]|eukprot:XP_008611000.1 hypothetical protein SDRG_06964 [Saprolegnia diclina VS20]
MFTDVAAYVKRKDDHVKFLVDEWFGAVVEAKAGLKERPPATAHGLYGLVLALACDKDLALAMAGSDLHDGMKSTWAALHCANLLAAKSARVAAATGFANLVLRTDEDEVRVAAICPRNAVLSSPKLCFIGGDDIPGLRLAVVLSNVALTLVPAPVVDPDDAAAGSNGAAPVGNNDTPKAAAHYLVVDAPIVIAALNKAAALGVVVDLPAKMQEVFAKSKTAVLADVDLSANTSWLRHNFVAHAPLRESAPALSKAELRGAPAPVRGPSDKSAEPQLPTRNRPADKNRSVASSAPEPIPSPSAPTTEKDAAVPATAANDKDALVVAHAQHKTLLAQQAQQEQAADEARRLHTSQVAALDARCKAAEAGRMAAEARSHMLEIELAKAQTTAAVGAVQNAGLQEALGVASDRLASLQLHNTWLAAQLNAAAQGAPAYWSAPPQGAPAYWSAPPRGAPAHWSALPQGAPDVDMSAVDMEEGFYDDAAPAPSPSGQPAPPQADTTPARTKGSLNETLFGLLNEMPAAKARSKATPAPQPATGTNPFAPSPARKRSSTVPRKRPAGPAMHAPAKKVNQA